MFNEKIKLIWADKYKKHVQSVLSSLKGNRLHHYASAFNLAKIEIEKQKDNELAESDLLFNGICSMALRTDNAEEPFRPLFSGPNGRSMISDDLNDVHLNFLNASLTNIQDEQLKARIGDILWIRRKDHKAGNIATTAYLKSADALFDPNTFVYFTTYLERGLLLAGYFGRHKTTFKEIVKFLENKIDDTKKLESGLCLAKLLNIWFDYVRTEKKIEQYSKIAFEASELRKQNNEYLQEREFLNICVKFSHSLKKDEDTQNAYC